MSNALQAIPTEYGLDILTSTLKNTVTQYALWGATTHDATDIEVFHSDTIESSYFDDNGVLTFQLNLPIETNFKEYLHKIVILDESDQVVIECATPKVALAKGIGGMVTLKAAVSGEAGEVVFKASEYVTQSEFNELHFTPAFDEHLADYMSDKQQTYVQDIFIGGSKDMLYPVWFQFPSGRVGNLTLYRNYAWDEPERPLNQSSVHQASLLLELEGCAYGWNGDANFMTIKRFHERYNKTCSHVAFRAFCKAEKIDTNKPLYSTASPNFSAQCSRHSGVYLRGGGLHYRITTNWNADISFHNGSDSDPRTLYENINNVNVRWFAEPIPFSELSQPPVNVQPYGVNSQ